MASAKKPTKAAAAPAVDRVRREHHGPAGCCPPRALLYIDSLSEQIWVDNSMQRRSSLDVTATLAQATTTPPAPGMVQQGASDSKLEDTILKEQGKVYRTDRYTVHWEAEGQCHPLQVSLDVAGEVNYRADCLPDRGAVTLSRTYLLVPPGYAPPGPGSLTAALEVTDCAGMAASCCNTVPRP